MKHLEDYRAIHSANPRYGTGPTALEMLMIKAACAFRANSRVIDYGCGRSLTLEALFPFSDKTFYDPAIIGLDSDPVGRFDIGICTDVMEHIPIDEITEALNRHAILAPFWVYLIHKGPAAQLLPNGDNSHVTQRACSWWSTAISAVIGRAIGIDINQDKCMIIADASPCR